MPRLPYYTPIYGWRFILLLHRLAGLDVPLRISAASGMSINTARAKIFQGRQLILETDDTSLARYAPLARRCVIHTTASILTIEKADGFDGVYSDLSSDSFTIIYRTIIPQLLSDTKAFSVSFHPHQLSPPQIKALKDFLTNFPQVKFTQVNATSVTIAR